MKRIISVFLLSILLIGCQGKNDKETEEKDDTSKQEVTQTIKTVEDVEAIETVELSEFNKSLGHMYETVTYDEPISYKTEFLTFDLVKENIYFINDTFDDSSFDELLADVLVGFQKGVLIRGAYDDLWINYLPEEFDDTMFYQEVSGYEDGPLPFSFDFLNKIHENSRLLKTYFLKVDRVDVILNFYVEFEDGKDIYTSTIVTRDNNLEVNNVSSSKTVLKETIGIDKLSNATGDNLAKLLIPIFSLRDHESYYALMKEEATSMIEDYDSISNEKFDISFTQENILYGTRFSDDRLVLSLYLTEPIISDEKLKALTNRLGSQYVIGDEEGTINVSRNTFERVSGNPSYSFGEMEFEINGYTFYSLLTGSSVSYDLFETINSPFLRDGKTIYYQSGHRIMEFKINDYPNDKHINATGYIYYDSMNDRRFLLIKSRLKHQGPTSDIIQYEIFVDLKENKEFEFDKFVESYLIYTSYLAKNYLK